MNLEDGNVGEDEESPVDIAALALFFTAFSYFHILSGTASASKNSELYLALVVRKKLALSASGKLALSERHSHLHFSSTPISLHLSFSPHLSFAI